MAATFSPRPQLRSFPAPTLRLVPATRSHPVQGLLGPRPTVAVAGLFLALLLLVGGAIAVGRGGLASLAPAPPAAAAAPAPGARTIMVEPGDTIWSIARRLQPTGDLRTLVDRLVAAHGTGDLQPGDRLAVGR
jgi:hypothetical protein